ncbi:MAG TPA: response regulator [Bacteroidales bacterium]|nr:response regulator [Bacteroidales bacterium]
MYTILIIDDEPLILEGLQQALELEGHKTYSAANGKDAVSLIDAGLKPDLVITDIIMPEKDGIEVIWSIQEKIPETKIIAISGGGRISATDHLKIAEKLGANSVLTKPFSTEDLVNEIEKVFKE